MGAFEAEIALLKSELHGKALPDDSVKRLYPALDRVVAEVWETGVGTVTAALTFQEQLFRISKNVVEVLFLGSAGLYRREPKSDQYRQYEQYSQHSQHEQRNPSGQYSQHNPSGQYSQHNPSSQYSQHNPSGQYGQRNQSGQWGPGHYCLSHNFYNYDLGVLQGDAHFPKLQKAHIITQIGPLARLLTHPQSALTRSKAVQTLRQGALNTTASVTDIALDIEKTAFPYLDFENLEGYGLAQVATASHLPFAALLALTNEVGPEGSRKWRQNFQTMADTLQSSLLAQLALR